MMAEPWNAGKARKMRDAAVSWSDIGKHFGVTGTIVHCRLDATYAEHRKEQINNNRGGGRKAPTPNFHRVIPEREIAAAELEEPDVSPRNGVYRKHIPNRTALGSQPLTEKGTGTWVSLPHVSILGGVSLPYVTFLYGPREAKP